MTNGQYVVVTFPLTFTPQGDWNLRDWFKSLINYELSANLYPARGLKQPSDLWTLCRISFPLTFTPQGDWNFALIAWTMKQLAFPLTFTPQGDWNWLSWQTHSLFHCRLSANLYPARGLKPFFNLAHFHFSLLSANLYPARGLKQFRVIGKIFDHFFPLTFTPQGDWNQSISLIISLVSSLSANLYPARGLKRRLGIGGGYLGSLSANLYPARGLKRNW